MEILRGRSFPSGISRSDPYVVSAIAVGELHLGVARSSDPVGAAHALASFLAGTRILPVTEATAAEYGRIQAALLQQGTPIPTNDIWIAAAAVEHAVTLVSNDAHFDLVKGLDHRRI